MRNRSIVAISALSLAIGLLSGTIAKAAPMSSPAPEWALTYTDDAGDLYVADYRLSFTDCAGLLVAPGFDCIILPPCATEDSTRCYWDAATMGNGRGRSFINLETDQ